MVCQMSSVDKIPLAKSKSLHDSITGFFSRASASLQEKVAPRRGPFIETAFMREDYSIEVMIRPSIQAQESSESTPRNAHLEFVVTPKSPMYLDVLKNHPVLRPGIMHTTYRQV
jgi:hypothetical protein